MLTQNPHEGYMSPGEHPKPHVKFDYPSASYGQHVNFQNPSESFLHYKPKVVEAVQSGDRQRALDYVQYGVNDKYTSHKEKAALWKILQQGRRSNPHRNPQWLIGSALALAALYMFGRRTNA